MVMWTKSVDIDPDALSQSVRVRRLLPNDARSLRALWMAVQSQGSSAKGPDQRLALLLANLGREFMICSICSSLILPLLMPSAR